MKSMWRLFWILSLIVLWLFCSGIAEAEPLADRLAQFPNWEGKPLTQAARDDDLIYPEWFAGDWTVTTTLVDMVAPFAPEIMTPGFESNRQFLNQPIAFNVRFVEARLGRVASLFPLPLGTRQKEIVSDRAFNGENLMKAYLGDRSTLTVKVDPTNPNRQITLLQDDRQLVATVTARATESSSPDQFVTTEIVQQEFLGAPQIYFNEVENTIAYTRHFADEADIALTNPAITADQVTAIYLSPQDPDYFKTIAMSSFLGEPRPVALYRYHLEFTKDEG
jgi:hypothetical protein